MAGTYDLIIVGGGIGGSALATIMSRAGYSVLLLEKTDTYQDMVRGEWISPWGVKETQTLGLYDSLIAAGGHHVRRHVTYDETRTQESAEAAALSLSIFFEGIPGPLSIRHPVHCQTLFDEATKTGAETVRGATVTGIVNGEAPCVAYSVGNAAFTATARLVVGADGRSSQVRSAAGIALSRDKPHHWFAGLLVEGAEGWDEETQVIGTENQMGFLAFPQGNGRVRLYGGYALDETRRFAGVQGPQRFLEAFNVRCSPDNHHLVNARPAGPLMSYHNNDSWTDLPFSERIVLVGDAAGWNDPILGLGLSITYRDVRIVSDILKGTTNWSAASFAAYGEERQERMRRLRFIAKIAARIDMEFDEEARARRRSFLARVSGDPSIASHLVAVMAGPESAPEAVFTEAYLNKVYGGELV